MFVKTYGSDSKEGTKELISCEDCKCLIEKYNANKVVDVYYDELYYC